MYTFELDDEFLSDEEKEIFKASLIALNLDAGVWKVFDSLFRSGVKGTRPVLLRISEDSVLCGAIILIKCSEYGRSLFNNRLLSGLTDLIRAPFYLWIKFGCCMDMMSNPGFVRDPQKSEEIFSSAALFLKSHSILTIILDYSDKSYLYPQAAILPSMPHALIDTTEMSGINDYIRMHKNIKHKINIFKNNGGEFELVTNVMEEQDLARLKKCFISTSEKSIVYLPYQDLYLNSALTTSKTRIDDVFYFIMRLNGEFLGYQAAIKTGTCLNALHGAFDRDRKTTFHAYEVLFVEMTKFAIENNLKTIDFGAVINVSKQRMINRTIPLSYFLFCKYRVVQWLFKTFLKLTKIQGNDQMRYIKGDV